MGVHKKTRKFQIKKIIGQRDARLKKNQDAGKSEEQKNKKSDDVIREAYVIVRFYLYMYVADAK